MDKYICENHKKFMEICQDLNIVGNQFHQFVIFTYVYLDNPYDKRNWLFPMVREALLNLGKEDIDNLPDLFHTKEKDRILNEWGVLSTSSSYIFCENHLQEQYQGEGEIYNIDNTEIDRYIDILDWYSDNVNLNFFKYVFRNDLKFGKGFSISRPTSEFEFLVLFKSPKILAKVVEFC